MDTKKVLGLPLGRIAMIFEAGTPELEDMKDIFQEKLETQISTLSRILPQLSERSEFRV